MCVIISRERMGTNMKRYRATVVIFRDDKVLLVRDKGRHDFSLPGGGFKYNETTIQAGIREVCGEETGGTKVLSAERLKYCDLDGKRAYHKVCLLTIEGEPYIKRPREIDKIIWWDMKSKIPVQGHVKYILGKLGKNV
jgi:ADP-ribose pyrophosphatase YjhB (NUDIX family)